MANQDLQELGTDLYFLPGGVNVAIAVGSDREAVLIDTGQDKEHGRRIRKACEALGVRPVAVINTHAHADHFGGNAYLLRQFDLAVHAPPFESELMASPYLEPVYLYHGAKPLPELTGKWLMAPPSPTHHRLEPGALELAGREFELLDTSGHAHRQLSVRVGDVLLAADALLGQALLERYPLPFGQDLGRQLSSARCLRELDVRLVLPGHGEPTADLAGLADANVAALEQAQAAVEAACTGVGTEEVLAATCRTLGIELTDLPRYHLNLCTVAAHLAHLREQGRVGCALEDGRLLWQRR